MTIKKSLTIGLLWGACWLAPSQAQLVGVLSQAASSTLINDVQISLISAVGAELAQSILDLSVGSSSWPAGSTNAVLVEAYTEIYQAHQRLTSANLSLTQSAQALRQYAQALSTVCAVRNIDCSKSLGWLLATSSSDWYHGTIVETYEVEALINQLSPKAPKNCQPRKVVEHYKSMEITTAAGKSQKKYGIKPKEMLDREQRARHEELTYRINRQQEGWIPQNNSQTHFEQLRSQLTHDKDFRELMTTVYQTDFQNSSPYIDFGARGSRSGFFNIHDNSSGRLLCTLQFISPDQFKRAGDFFYSDAWVMVMTAYDEKGKPKKNRVYSDQSNCEDLMDGDVCAKLHPAK